MSAAAVAVPKRIQSLGWTATPHAYFKKLFRCLTQVQMAVLGNILDETIGNDKDGRPTWARITESKLAFWANCTVDGVRKAVDQLEKLKLIEVRKAGRNNEYCCLVENWGRAEARKARKLVVVRKPVRSEGQDEEPEPDEVLEASVSSRRPKVALQTQTQARTNQVLVILPGASRPVPLASVCPNAAQCPVVNGGVKAPIDIAKNRGADADNKEVKVKIPVQEYRYSDVQNLASELFGTALQALPPDTVIADVFQLASEAGISLSQLRHRWNLRGNAVVRHGWWLLVNLTRDIIRFAEAEASAKQPKPGTGEGPWTATGIAKFLTANATRLDEAGYLDFAVELRLYAQKAPHIVANGEFDHLETQLARIDEAMIDRGGAQLTDAQRDVIERDVAKQLKAHRGKMTADQIQSLEQLHRERAIRQALNLPGLSLGYIGGS